MLGATEGDREGYRERVRERENEMVSEIERKIERERYTQFGGGINGTSNRGRVGVMLKLDELL